ncbi:hypothetical protein TSOC_012667 [Tetrabaena socialis]|uniref:Uncharacterized protein n=1 Tax=Tetrabaena socialis TaxID=47790 RepID=A0A2J7ZMG1_9CHLO|nr:hypothetical protein TSOC_012667 [Tetrabaena socialis]|eukprot:PNH01447.1 hypothetical protein TSOC_012667 [Tetrabaena socialis]
MDQGAKAARCQCTREVACPDIYVAVSLSFPDMAAEAAAASISTQLFKDVLTRALTDLYGVVGGAVGFSLLDLRGSCGILRLDKRKEV